MPRSSLNPIILWGLFFISVRASSQDPISGIVNTYHKVVEIIPAKACLRVADITGLDVNSKIMILQMKGATINLTATNANFGDTTATNGAGLYEIATVCYIIGDSVFLFHDLLNTYDVTKKVQIVQFSEHYSAIVTDVIKPVLWDSTTGLGGVIAISVDETLELQADIYGDTSGYSGGAFFQHSGTCGFLSPAGTNYAYDATNNSNLNGAYKGEGICNIPSNLDGAKGAASNGGGGGNNHNNSGGGGSNLTAGGRGGGNSSNGPVGCNTANNMGLGAKALSSWSGQKIYFGGGGGAGHTNFNAFTSGGGDGGGIIFIRAAILIGNGNTISANGENGAPSVGDGAGGGGAGGTIIMDVGGYSGSVNIEANGGKGGDSNDNGTPDRCFGGGGGGSGGVIYFTGSTPGITYSVTAGAGGVETGSAGSCNTPVPGLAGTAGQVISGYTYRRSLNEASYCELLLPVQLTVFTATKTGKKVALHWEAGNPQLAEAFIIEKAIIPGSWADWKSVTAYDNQFVYSALDLNPLPGKSFYRLKILEKDGSVSYSPTRQVEFTMQGFMVYPNPASDKIIITGEFENTIEINLLDLSGRLLFACTKKDPSSFIEIDLPKLAAGVYMLRVNRETKKLVIR